MAVKDLPQIAAVVMVIADDGDDDGGFAGDRRHFRDFCNNIYGIVTYRIVSLKIKKY